MDPRLALLLLPFATACTALGWRFGPGASAANRGLFAEPPAIVLRAGGPSLRWTFGGIGFFFEPECRPIGGRLVCALQGTSSSGSLSGRTWELKIEGAQALSALRRGGAFWWEPDGSLRPLRVIEEEAQRGAALRIQLPPRRT